MHMHMSYLPPPPLRPHHIEVRGGFPLSMHCISLADALFGRDGLRVLVSSFLLFFFVLTQLVLSDAILLWTSLRMGTLKVCGVKIDNFYMYVCYQRCHWLISQGCTWWHCILSTDTVLCPVYDQTYLYFLIFKEVINTIQYLVIFMLKFPHSFYCMWLRWVHNFTIIIIPAGGLIFSPLYCQWNMLILCVM